MHSERSYTCRCGKPIFFRNSVCLACKAPLGYEPDTGKLYSLEPAGDLWKVAGRKETYRRCANLDSVSGCNWLVDSTEEQNLCRSCRMDRTIPDLSVPADAECYRRISIAQRRLVSMLITLGLPVDDGPNFDLLRSLDGSPRVMTGHADGVITLNIEEAEDSTRERIRDEMGEPYRTLLGHLRHETGHYYWDRLVQNTPWLAEYRKVFGDEQQDYAAALQAHYQNGPVADWQSRFVSTYAGSHPWEDWAETWAHYLHMVDTFDTAASFGLDPDASIDLRVEPFKSDALFKPDDREAESFLQFVNAWTRLTAVLNELSRAMGLADFYPFVLSKPVVAKLQLIQLVIGQSSVISVKAA